MWLPRRSELSRPGTLPERLEMGPHRIRSAAAALVAILSWLLISGCGMEERFQGEVKGPIALVPGINQRLIAECSTESSLEDGRRLIVVHLLDGTITAFPPAPLLLVVAVRGHPEKEVPVAVGGTGGPAEAWLMGSEDFRERFRREKPPNGLWNDAVMRYCAEFVQSPAAEQADDGRAERLTGTVTIKTQAFRESYPFEMLVALQSDDGKMYVRGEFKRYADPQPEDALDNQFLKLLVYLAFVFGA